MDNETLQAPMFTCLSCLIAFMTAEDQREHYRSDHHRYNMKRRVASLPPVSAKAFNQKVLDKRLETAITTADRGATCEVCNKAYTTENAYRSHINSKKHKENEYKALLKARSEPPVVAATSTDEVPSAPEAATTSSPSVTDLSHADSKPSSSSSPGALSDADADDDDPDGAGLSLEERIAAARSKLGPTHCLFCSSTSSSLADNLSHMANVHSFFIPDADYLVDLPGLITYLGEKIAIGNECLHCNGRGREFRSLHAVRKHMIDKSHCKLAYETEKDRLEIADFYDFSSSYPIASFKSNSRRTKRRMITASTAAAEESSATDASNDDEWEDEDEENVTIQDGESVYDVESDDDNDSDEPSENVLTYGDLPYELVLPSGARIGHRSMRRYYKQSFVAPLASPSSDPTRGAGLVRRLLEDKNSALVPSKGGFGAFGDGTMTVKARNRGEAREAGRHVREFRDQKKRENFKTAVGFRGNHQKHYRDPLLQ